MHTHRYGFSTGPKSSIIVAPGRTVYRATGRTRGRGRGRRSHTFGDSPGGKIPITQCPINQSRYIRCVYIYTFNRPGNWSNLVGRNEPKRVRRLRIFYTHIYIRWHPVNNIRTRLWRTLWKAINTFPYTWVRPRSTTFPTRACVRVLNFLDAPKSNRCLWYASGAAGGKSTIIYTVESVYYYDLRGTDRCIRTLY